MKADDVVKVLLAGVVFVLACGFAAALVVATWLSS